VIKAAKDFPDLDFLLYHAGLLRVATDQSADVPWTTEFCQMKKKEPGLRNIYMELGSTFGQLATTNPTACAHLLGQCIDAFGADHVLWGTDAIWYGTPQWQIEAFRRFEIPPALTEKHGYAPLTRPVKEQIFGLNAARMFGVDVNAKRNEIPKDYLTRMKMAYLDGGARPSHRWYGWVAV
jgi:predicted TIM-barrel fold metal-dependent hydrolase